MIGVLALQGGVVEHIRAVERCGEKAVEVRTPVQLGMVDALIIPGGESTTLFKLMKRAGMDSAIRSEKMPVFGTCAGMIVLAKEIINNGREGLGKIDISVRRNDYGRQVDSFEDHILVKGLEKPFNAVFIRAPAVKSYGKDVEVLAEHRKRPVLLKHKNIMAASFHPELTEDIRIHRLFIELVRKNG